MLGYPDLFTTDTRWLGVDDLVMHIAWLSSNEMN